MTDVFLAPLIMISNVNAQVYPSFLYIFSLLVFMVKIVILEYLEESRAIYTLCFPCLQSNSVLASILYISGTFAGAL